ncbi:MAG: glycerol-3-phosphate responsive antiterminator [Chloroflexi bacterium]|nr:MAG: glycerol-3-phosphate responsive antiterminator [Chloroflexota bacterium]
MIIQSRRSLLSISSQCKIIPIVESRVQFTQVFDSKHVNSVLLRHCNLFDFTTILSEAQKRSLSVYVNIDHIDGIHADAAGLRYLAEYLQVSGIISNHPRILSQGKNFGLETIQRIFAVDSTGLEMALESVDTHCVDVLDISPGLVTPYITAQNKELFPLPFIASGLIHTPEQVQSVLQSGAIGVAVSRPELWL